MVKEVYADIIIDISHEALDKVFQYRVPLSLMEEVKVGSQVLVPFGAANTVRGGYVIDFHDDTDYPKEKIKEILSIEKERISVDAELIKVASFLKHRYGSSMIQALRTVLPVKTRMKLKETVTIELKAGRDQAEQLLDGWKRRHAVALSSFMEELLTAGRMPKEKAVKDCHVTIKKLRELEEDGVITLIRTVAYRDYASRFTSTGKRLPLTGEQQTVVNSFLRDYEDGIRRTYLLHGITGSGKTEVYLSMIEEMISRNKTAIVLIPEISLTYQTVRRFYERFGDRIAVLHSKMSAGERSDACERLRRGEADVVIGARSALFAPVRNLGLIIIDEEHDGAYKSDHSPKYHARETAIYRAGLAGASVILGSATPSVEAYARAKSGEYTLYTLKNRPGTTLLPEVEIVSLKEELEKGNRSVFSESLTEKIRDRLNRKEQVILFLNRRGFAGFVSCRSCGIAMTCPHCDVSLTYHRDGTLRCHYCGYETPHVKVCPACHSPHVAAFGLGTEKVEAALAKTFPEARVLRMDRDTTVRKNSHEEILSAFGKGEADILIGTQMIVKGHDYENVTLVGILAADLSLYTPGYTGSERTFQLLCQAAGRAGRGRKPGEVVVQTYAPDHYAIKAAADQDYDAFFEEEYTFRSMMGYPPCSNMMEVTITGADEKNVILAQGRIHRILEQSQQDVTEPVVILNPGQGGIAKIKDIYRRTIYLKHSELAVILDLRDRLIPVFSSHEMFAGLQIQFDVF